MPFVDSMNFYVRSRIPDKYGEYPLIRVRNVIEDMSGELLIDHPSNRSGKIYMPEYPIFNSKKYLMFIMINLVFTKMYITEIISFIILIRIL